MPKNHEPNEGDAAEAERVEAERLAGKLRIELAGVVLGHVEIPVDLEPAAVTERLRFELKPPAV